MSKQSTYPFIVRGVSRTSRTRLRKVKANNFANALHKVLAKEPDKFVRTTFARNIDSIKRVPKKLMTVKPVPPLPKKLTITNTIKTKKHMDLISAKVEAAKRSRSEKKKILIICSDKDGECETSNVEKKDYTTMHAYVNGSEIALDPEQSEATSAKEKSGELKVNTKTKNKKPMAKAAKATSAKKGKPAAKKAAKKEIVDGVPKATTLVYTDAQWAKVHKHCADKGTTIRDISREGVAKIVGFAL